MRRRTLSVCLPPVLFPQVGRCQQPHHGGCPCRTGANTSVVVPQASHEPNRRCSCELARQLQATDDSLLAPRPLQPRIHAAWPPSRCWLPWRHSGWARLWSLAHDGQASCNAQSSQVGASLRSTDSRRKAPAQQPVQCRRVCSTAPVAPLLAECAATCAACQALGQTGLPPLLKAETQQAAVASNHGGAVAELEEDSKAPKCCQLV
jgi:hypothetical protein